MGNRQQFEFDGLFLAFLSRTHILYKLKMYYYSCGAILSVARQFIERFTNIL